MSGGHFNDNERIYYKVYQFADELENELENNSNPDNTGFCPDLPPEVITFLGEQVSVLREMSETMRLIDLLYSGDLGPDSFMQRVEESRS